MFLATADTYSLSRSYVSKRFSKLCIASVWESANSNIYIGFSHFKSFRHFKYLKNIFIFPWSVLLLKMKYNFGSRRAYPLLFSYKYFLGISWLKRWYFWLMLFEETDYFDLYHSGLVFGQVQLEMPTFIISNCLININNSWSTSIIWLEVLCYSGFILSNSDGFRVWYWEAKPLHFGN